MKIIVFSLLLSTALGLSACQSAQSNQSVAKPTQQALQWQGVYVGNLPCASCEGIESRVSLFDNGLFTKTDTYLGEKSGKFTENGEIQWSADKKTIRLVSNDSTSVYQVKAGALVLLDENGQPATGAFSESYILKKQ